MPYLRAIQAVPGDTASEKLSWIGRAAWAVGYPEQLPQLLEPLMKVEVALRQEKHKDLEDCITSDDAMVINRALKADWFFNSNNNNIGLVMDSFCGRIFPYVSVNTRSRIINKLADNVTNVELAEFMFEELLQEYGIYDVCPLLVACGDEFAFETMDSWKLALPIKTAKKIFRRNPDLLIRYFKLLKPAKLNERASFPIDMNHYSSFLPKLVRNRVHNFAELFEMYEDCPLRITLSNKRAEMFLKKGLQYLIQKPHLYINILPLKKISIEILETIFLGLLPMKISNFDTDKMLQYLEYYPQSKKYELLRESYLKKYETELLNEKKNVTPQLLRLLPEKERIKQARIKLEKDSFDYSYSLNYESVWICYLPIDEAIPNIKENINKKASDSERLFLIRQLIYTCKVNEKIKDSDASANEKDASGDEKNASTNEKDALVEIFKYFIQRHKNEDSWVFEQTMHQVMRWYDVPHLSKERHKFLFDIIKLFYVKFGYILETIAEAVIHFRLINNMPIDELILMLIETNKNKCHINFSLLRKYPQYERKCLVTFAKYIEEKYSAIWKEEDRNIEHKKTTLCRLVIAMYKFNDRCEKSHTKIEHVTVKDYPWLLDIIRAIIKSNKLSWNTKDILKINAPELMDGRSEEDPSKKKIVDVTTCAALALLKRNPQEILDNWEDYLMECKRNHMNKIAQRFVKATRWYKDIPIRFAERSLDYLEEKHKDNEGMLSTLTILALLLHGETLTNLLLPLIPKKLAIDTGDPEASENYRIVCHLPLCMRISNPPVSISLIYKLCEGDYLSIALGALMNMTRRFGLHKSTILARKLSNMRVGTRKHGIRLMYELCRGKDLLCFLKETWDNETHHSIREVIFQITQKMMFLTPTQECLDLHMNMMNTIQLKDEMLLSQLKLPLRLSNKCVSAYFDVWLKAINKLKFQGLDIDKVNRYLIAVLNKMSVQVVCNLISEELAIQIMKNLLFNVDTHLSVATRWFLMSYFFEGDSIKIKERSKILIEYIGYIMRTQWNKSHSKKSGFFPYNNTIHLFMEDFVINYVNKFYFVNKSTDMQLIDDMLNLFLSVLDPTQAPSSYLLLIYTKKLQECLVNNKCFGWQIDQFMPELIKIFSSSLVQFMAKILLRFLNFFQKHINLQEFKLSLMENLIKADNRDSWLLAVTILSPVTLEYLAIRYDELIKKFQEIKDPAISSVLHDYLNMAHFNSMSFD